MRSALPALTVPPLSLVTADPETITYGQPLPAITATVEGSLAGLNGDGRVTVKASKRLRKGLYTLLATWAGGGEKRFNVRVR